MDQAICDIPETAHTYCGQMTDGTWDDEASAVAALDARLAMCKYFTVFPEVEGEYVQPRYRAEKKDPRIDRLLMPTRELVAAGWNYGAIGVECKASGVKIGPVIAQCQDYGRANFRLPSGISVVCEWIFIWPLGSFQGDIASVMAQNRIGGLIGNNYDLLRFKTPAQNLMTIGWKGELDIYRKTPCGYKTGSR